VSLGGFFSVTLLILVLMLARAAVRRLLHFPSYDAPWDSRLDLNPTPGSTVRA
jgi:hypothetical protein